jgi:hypothetical protein
MSTQVRPRKVIAQDLPSIAKPVAYVCVCMCVCNKCLNLLNL